MENKLARAAQRMQAKADLLIVKTLGAPEALITSLVKLERLKLRAPDALLRTRLKAIATEAGIDEVKLAALMEPGAEPGGSLSGARCNVR